MTMAIGRKYIGAPKRIHFPISEGSAKRASSGDPVSRAMAPTTSGGAAMPPTMNTKNLATRFLDTTKKTA
jgi:hypothetical protein